MTSEVPEETAAEKIAKIMERAESDQYRTAQYRDLAPVMQLLIEQSNEMELLREKLTEVCDRVDAMLGENANPEQEPPETTSA